VPGTVRFDRALSKLGLASRAEAQRLIREGLVTLSGQVVTDPAQLVTPETAVITIAGRNTIRAPWRTLAFHKPRGVVTSRRDPEGRKTVFDVLGSLADGLVAVGRLDLASSGLLLLTNDTRLAAWLTDPDNAVVRRYVVTARGSVTDDAARHMERGIGGLQARAVEVRKRSNRETHLVIELTEGKNREIRRLLGAVGHEVTRLLRVAFGPIELGPLQPGQIKEIERTEMAAAFPLSPLAAPRADRWSSPAVPARNPRPARRPAAPPRRR
jgi:23S rRNA pseudouridine2605 synthase